MAKKGRFITSYKIGQDNIQKWGLDVHNPVFFISAVLVILFVVSTLVNPAGAKKIFDATKGWTIQNFDWFFMISGNIFVLSCLSLICSPAGKIRLGGPDAKPEFRRASWFAMLFAAGMGIGLMFWSVAEPVAYFTDWWGTPLNVAARTPDAASAAMAATMFHWGLHPWAIYAVTALALAFFAFNKGMPLTIRSTFYPVLGEKTWKLPGDIIDVVAVMATIFGLATSLGFGAQQAGSGLNFLFGIESTIGLQVVIIIAVLLVPTVLTVIWMQAFGGNALLQIQTNVGALTKGLGEVSLATFQMLANLPLTQITSLLGIVLALVFFVTSSDSGSLVVDSITAGGKLDAPMIQRVFWAVMEGAIAAALLVGGGADALGAIQAVAVTVGLPFTLVMLVMIFSTYLGIRSENLADYRPLSTTARSDPLQGTAKIFSQRGEK